MVVGSRRSAWIHIADLDDLPRAALSDEGDGDVPSRFGEVGGFAGDAHGSADAREVQPAGLDAFDLQWEIPSDDVPRVRRGSIDGRGGQALLVQQVREAFGAG
jgi:hypothetical protein